MLNDVSPETKMAVHSDFPPESQFTAPHRVAPNPQWWHAPDGDSTECEVSELVGALVRALQPDLVVETGTAFGYTALAIGQALVSNRHGRLVTLETDDDRRDEARKLLRLHTPSLLAEDDGPITLSELSSLEWDPTDARVDFAFFDSLYELRSAEFRRFRDLGALRAGSIVAFHDWTSRLRGQDFDVRREIEQLEAEALLRAIYLPTPRGVALAEVLE